MEVNAEGYFKRIDKNIRLVNLEAKSMEKLKNCGKNLRLGENAKTPILPNGLVIKHDTRALVYDIDGKPTSTGMLIGQKVKVSLKIRKYKFKPSKKDDFIVGWTVKLLKMNAI